MKAERIESGANPGGWVVHFYIDDHLIDVMTKGSNYDVEFTEDMIGGILTIRAYDGDTGLLINEDVRPWEDLWEEDS